MKKFLLSGILTAMIFSIYAQTQVGRTRYDLQTNNSVCRRIAINPVGEIVATYTRSHKSATAYDDRGTGYNYSSDNGATWTTTDFTGAFNRFDTTRTGWPNVVYTNSKEVIISHFASGSLNGLQVLRRDLGTTGTWDKTVLNSTSPNTNTTNATYADDATWARAASKGDSIFVIFGLIDTDMPGMDGGMQMYRSLDGGDTWMGPDDIPLMNSSNFVRNGGDNYALDISSTGKVAIVLGRFQVEVLTSTDFGNTFSKQTIVAAKDENGVATPLFNGASGETLQSMDGSDGSYSIVVDDNDMVHVWFGRRRWLKTDASTSSASYMPANGGLMYWNSSMTDAKVIHESRLRAQQSFQTGPLFTSQYFDSSTGWGNQLDLYGSALTSMSSGAFDDAGNLYVAFASVVPGTQDSATATILNNVNSAGLHFTDVYLMKSPDNGATWIGPLNVSDSSARECVYPGIPRKIYGTSIPIIWQQDELPSVELQKPTGVTHPTVENQIYFKNVPVADIVSPADWTNPTIVANEATDTTVDAFVGCPIDFNSKFNTDDVPMGPNVLNYNIIYGGNINTVGIHTIQIYTVDNAGNSSDTIGAIVNVLADAIAPTVTFNGPDTLFALVSNGTYTDPGVVITDNACQPTAAAVETDNVTANITSGNVGNYYSYDYSVTDNSGNNTTVQRWVQIIGADIVPPVITPNNGLTTETHEATCGASWVDAGVTAFDNVDFNVSTTTTQNVDFSTPGTYMVYDTAIDASGNVGFLERTIIIEDNTAPTLSIDFEGSVLYVCKGETDLNSLFPTATANDCVTSSPTITDNRSSIDVNVAAIYPITFNAVDAAGNLATPISIDVNVGSAPDVDFEITSVDGPEVLVTDLSTNNPTLREWDFSDGPHDFTSSSTQTHTYQAYGSYDITLTSTNDHSEACGKTGAAAQKTKTVEIDGQSIGINEVNKLNDAIDIFPNPTKGTVNISITQILTNVEISIYNVVGDLIATKTLENTSKNNTVSFDLNNNATGVYFVNIVTEKASTSKKVIVE